ncbi:catalase [Rhodococcus sp. Eu-32]|uniref:manganese catalase family protein n=1 Tax=Rhodococcus sp. Eu-32 TaxID=1017319 RepID=UPI000DF45B47|nr:manganese catalase family protein [Rhodococcus sp. Eu-32]RRQ26595.1 catalase [Rhodococcus sp. Eu-32]
MFRHTDYLQFDVKPEKPDPVYARKLQELIGGAYGEMTVTMQYLFQGWNCRMEGKYKDLIMDIATEEIGHVEMLATMVARLLEGAPATESTKAAAADPVVAAVMGGMDPQQAIVAGGGAMPQDSNGVPWNGRYIVASGNLLADFRANVAAEAQGRVQTARLYNMTDDPGVKAMLKFNLARDTHHQNLWLAAIEELQADGLEGVVAPDALLDEEATEHATDLWHLSDGEFSSTGGWANRLAPDGARQMGFLADPQPLGNKASAPAPDPKLYATYDGAKGDPASAALGTEKGMMGKIKDALDPDET